MDLNSAIEIAERRGEFIRDDATMRAGWTIRYIADEKLLYFFDPKNEKAHKVRFNDAHRASFQWRVAPACEAARVSDSGSSYASSADRAPTHDAEHAGPGGGD